MGIRDLCSERRRRSIPAVAAVVLTAFSSALARRALMMDTGYVYPAMLGLVEIWFIWCGVFVARRIFGSPMADHVPSPDNEVYDLTMLPYYAPIGVLVTLVMALGGSAMLRMQQDPFAGALAALAAAVVLGAERYFLKQYASLRVYAAAGLFVVFSIVARAYTGPVSATAVFAGIVLLAALPALLVYGRALLSSHGMLLQSDTVPASLRDMLWSATPIATLLSLILALALRDFSGITDDWPARGAAGAVFSVIFTAGLAGLAFVVQLYALKHVRAADVVIGAAAAEAVAYAIGGAAYSRAGIAGARALTGGNVAGVVLSVLAAAVYAVFRLIEDEEPPGIGPIVIGDDDDGAPAPVTVIGTFDATDRANSAYHNMMEAATARAAPDPFAASNAAMAEASGGARRQSQRSTFVVVGRSDGDGDGDGDDSGDGGGGGGGGSDEAYRG